MRRFRTVVWSLAACCVPVGLAGSASAAPITTFAYTYSPTANEPAPQYADSTGAELNDDAFGATSSPSGPSYLDPNWVGTQGDTNLPKPQVVVSFDQAYDFDGLTVNYLVDHGPQVYAPGRVDITFSNDLVFNETPVTYTGFDNTGPGPLSLSLPIALTGESGQYLRLSFHDPDAPINWIFLGELDFAGSPVPEPASATLLLLGGPLALRRQRRTA